MTDLAAKTKQLSAWTGAFGDAYIDRNPPEPALLQPRVKMWSRMLDSLVGRPPQSILEVGANIGLNLRALRQVSPATLFAVEPNAKALGRLVEDGVVPQDRAFQAMGGALPLADGAVEMAFTSGVLIHIAPDDLPATMGEMHRVSSRYIACVEYFSDQPREIRYRGEEGLLFTRDFGGLWMDSFPDLQLVDYGFFWRRATGLDNLTWWVFEKR